MSEVGAVNLLLEDAVLSSSPSQLTIFSRLSQQIPSLAGVQLAPGFVILNFSCLAEAQYGLDVLERTSDAFLLPEQLRERAVEQCAQSETPFVDLSTRAEEGPPNSVEVSTELKHSVPLEMLDLNQ